MATPVIIRRRRGGRSTNSAPPINLTVPVITGTLESGSMLTSSNGTWANSPTSYTYQWKRNGADIGSATNSTYLLTGSDVGTTITVTVTATNADGSASATSAGSVISNTASDFVFVILDMGQSNAIGRAEADRLALTTYPERPSNIYIYYKSDYTVAAGSFNNMQAGTNTFEPDLSASFRLFSGSIIEAQRLRDLTGNRCYVIPAGDGGTALEQNLTSPDWSPLSAAECFVIFLDRFFEQAMPSIIATHPGKTIAVLINWSQGETDASDGTATANYATNFAAFYTAVRARTAYSAYLTAAPWCVPLLNYMQTAGETTINSVFTAFAAAHSSNFFTFDLSAYPRKVDLSVAQKGGYTPTASDDEHQSYIGQIAKGELFAIQAKTFYGIGGSFPAEITDNTEFNPSTISASGVRLQFSRSKVTIDADNKITAAANGLSAGDFTMAAVTDFPRFKIDRMRGAISFVPLATVQRLESNNLIGTSLFAGSWSMGVWLKPRTGTAGAIRMLVHDIKVIASPNDSRILMALETDGRIYGAIGISGTIVQFKEATATFPNAGGNTITEWTHVAIVANNTTHQVSIYVNGVARTMDANPTFNGDITALNLSNYVNVTNKLQIGARRQAASNYDQIYYGMMSELTIQPVIYSVADIQNLMLNRPLP